MIAIPRHQRLFSLYHLEEGEMYIKEYAVICQFIYPQTDQIEQIPGIMHFASRSAIFEPDDQIHSIIKFPFRYFKERPKIQLISNKDMFKLKMSQMIEIPLHQGAYKSYETQTDVFIDFIFQKIENVAEIFFELIDKFNAKQSPNDFDSIEYLGTLYSFKFEYSLIKSLNEKYLLKNELIVKQLLPLIDIPGMLMLTDTRIYFQPVFTFSQKKCVCLKYIKIEKFYKRRVCVRDVGIEICGQRGKNLFVQFDNESNRDMIYALIENKTSIDTKTNITTVDKYTHLWVEGGLSNYDYLMLLNSAGNRTRNDLSQYPIFPWVLNNYHSLTLDINDKENFRDLSKPIGAINQKRLEGFKSRYQEMAEPKFLYGTHYSTPAYVIGYLFRKYPHYMLKFHSGKFDHPDRLFYSIEIDWDLCNSSCVKELIPEFYEGNTDFIYNKMNIGFGLNSSGEKIDNVKMPPWALNQMDFLTKMREALESPYVSENLHKWIDLIFGYKQRGQLALESNNLFHPSCYGQGIGNDVTSAKERITMMEINEFGQVPAQLFKTSHPMKHSKQIRDMSLILPGQSDPSEIKLDDDDSSMPTTIKDCFDKSTEEQQQNGFFDDHIISQLPSSITTAYTNINLNTVKEPPSTKVIPINSKDNDDYCYDFKHNFNKTYRFAQDHHKRAIISSAFISDNNTFVTGCNDGYIKVFNHCVEEITKDFFISTFPIKSLTTIYSTLLLGIGAGDCITIMNPTLGKVLSKIYAHESPINSIFYNHHSNLLISDSINGTINTWDLNQQNRIPSDSIFLDMPNKAQVISSDYNTNLNRHYALDSLYNVHISSINSNDSSSFPILNYLSDSDSKVHFIKGNICNPNYFFIATDDDMIEFDIRNQKVVSVHKDLKKLKNIFIDSKSYLCIGTNQVVLYGLEKNYENESRLNIMQKWTQFSNITHSNFDIQREMILLGMDNGDIFYSDIYQRKD